MRSTNSWESCAQSTSSLLPHLKNPQFLIVTYFITHITQIGHHQIPQDQIPRGQDTHQYLRKDPISLPKTQRPHLAAGELLRDNRLKHEPRRTIRLPHQMLHGRLPLLWACGNGIWILLRAWILLYFIWIQLLRPRHDILDPYYIGEDVQFINQDNWVPGQGLCENGWGLSLCSPWRKVCCPVIHLPLGGEQVARDFVE